MKPGADVTRPLTPNQLGHLMRLHDARAFDRESAVSAFDPRAVTPLSAMVIGALCDLGLADKAVRRQGRRGSQCTVYWLTLDGVGVARRREAA